MYLTGEFVRLQRMVPSPKTLRAMNVGMLCREVGGSQALGKTKRSQAAGKSNENEVQV